MKARLVPVTFQSGVDDEYRAQLANLASLLAGEAEILEPVPLGTQLP